MKGLSKMLIFALAAFLFWQGLGVDEAEQKEVIQPAATQPAEEQKVRFSDCYVYSTLTEPERRLYGQIYDAVTLFADDAEVSAEDTESVQYILECVLADHPEIFYVDGFECVTHQFGEDVTGITFSAVYNLEQEEIEDRQKQLFYKEEQILAGIPEQGDDYEKIRYLYEYLIENTEYVLNAPENQSMISALLYGKSVCQGYAKAFQYLCKKAGIEAALVSGTAEGEGHVWTLVRSGGNWYHVDPTWGDAFYRMENTSSEYVPQMWPQVNYDYLMITTEELLRTHTIHSLFTLPDCDVLYDNYYVREKLWFDSFDQSRLEELFREALGEKQELLTLKCADEAVYKEFHTILIEEQKIFEYLTDAGTLTYIDTPEQLTLTFWLK